jgi:hypothetical protein
MYTYDLGILVGLASGGLVLSEDDVSNLGVSLVFVPLSLFLTATGTLFSPICPRILPWLAGLL